ncbi:hypothetical protein [Vibrio crassostreae]|uniref:hypothetical protein n=1 Tax=Vibrio crassostreae TaxID=246167 RepID=UPI0040694B73
MTLNFSKQLESGSHSADAVLQARAEIDKVFKVLSRALADFLKLDVTLEIERVQTLSERFAAATALASGSNVSTKLSKQKTVFLTHDSGESVTLFSIEEDANGYPITVQFNKMSQLAYSEEELGEVLGNILSNSQFHLILRKLKDTVESKAENP